MRTLTNLLFCALLGFPAAAPAQNITDGCGSLALTMEALQEFAPRFVSADSVFVNYRQRNGLRALVGGEQPEPVTDTSICNQLGAKVTEDFASDEYWGRAKWTTAYTRFGPYYVVYIAEQSPPNVVGSSWGLMLFDVQTLARITMTFECNC